MTESRFLLEIFREHYRAMRPDKHDWQWLGPYASQRMFGITKERAQQYAKSFGGEAKQMEPE